jgi:hypothetical protein
MAEDAASGVVCKYFVATNECFSECADNSETSSATCVALPCNQRDPNGVGSCMVIGASVCYSYNSVCQSECPPFSSYNQDYICSLTECESRTPASGNQCATGPFDTCAYFSEMGESTGGCAVCPPSLYENIAGQCQLKMCLARIKNDSSPLRCGSLDCFYNGTGCNTECPQYSYPDDFGVCGSTAGCSQREPGNVPTNKCGSDCLYDAATNKCVLTCPQFNEINQVTRECELMDCSQRVRPVGASTDVCGPSCVYNGVTSQCADDCPQYFSPNAQSKICESSVTCDQRQFNATSSLRCGDGCVYDTVNGKCA